MWPRLRGSHPHVSVVSSPGQSRLSGVEDDLESPTPRFRRIERYTRDQGCGQRPKRELGQVFQPAIPEDRFQYDARILYQPMLEITAFTPATTGPG